VADAAGQGVWIALGLLCDIGKRQLLGAFLEFASNSLQGTAFRSPSDIAECFKRRIGVGTRKLPLYFKSSFV
jgi:hypothetical protein